MNVPKTQKELLQILEEQQKHIELTRKAVIRLEQKLKQAIVLIKRTEGNNFKLKLQTETLTVKLLEMQVKLNG